MFFWTRLNIPKFIVQMCKDSSISSAASPEQWFAFYEICSHPFNLCLHDCISKWIRDRTKHILMHQTIFESSQEAYCLLPSLLIYSNFIRITFKFRRRRKLSQLFYFIQICTHWLPLIIRIAILLTGKMLYCF